MQERPASERNTPTLQTILDALDDPDCRTILKETAEPMTVKELTDACDISQSTVYRKVDLLSDAALVRERVEVNPEGGRITRYQRDFDDVTVSVDDGEFSVDVSRPSQTVDERLATIWSRMGDEL